MIDLENAKKEFLDYTSQFDKKNKNIERKIGHSLRVMEISAKISKTLNLNQEEEQIASLIGLLHDIGRFKQYSQYQTFQDSKSIDHGKLGVEILLKENQIQKYVKDSKWNRTIEKAIYNHNKYGFDTTLTNKEEFFCKLIKDSDKLDILYEACEIFWKNQEKTRIKDSISPEVWQEFNHEKLVQNKNKNTEADIIVGMISFIFDFNFEESYKIIEDKKYIERMLKQFDFEKEETLNQIKEIKRYANKYIKKKIDKG